MKRLLLAALLPGLLTTACATAATAPTEAKAAATSTPADAVANSGAALAQAVQGSWRDPKNAARDRFRHPAETLAFFQVAPDETVVEITPGGGWYAEILAPYLREQGRYVAAVWDDAITGQPGYRYDLNRQLRAKFAGNAAVYGTPEVILCTSFCVPLCTDSNPIKNPRHHPRFINPSSSKSSANDTVLCASHRRRRGIIWAKRFLAAFRFSPRASSTKKR